ncbi:hypothetical protein MKW94_026212 [Papaver nudicaule]|uniref:DUF7865 domain-containing protein n=1 Tax=Papaver nudicaule TaxID=74823 RepID=A0AA41VTR9_PAPNU|nr:hypothetical protein [Papaver nudicaule]
MASSSGFFMICLLHSIISCSCGSLMIFYLDEISVIGHGSETAMKLLGSTPHDQLLIKTSDSFAGLLLCIIGFLLFMISFIRDKEFQSFFAKGCILTHILVALWRIFFEREVEILALHWPKQVVGDFLMAFSWVFFQIYTWREKYD